MPLYKNAFAKAPLTFKKMPLTIHASTNAPLTSARDRNPLNEEMISDALFYDQKCTKWPT